MENIYNEIVNIIVDVADLDRDDIKEESLLIDDLDLSSLEIMALVSKIEDKFLIKIGEKELMNMESVKDLVDFVSGGKGIG